MATYEYLNTNGIGTDGVLIASNSSTKVAFHGITPCIQASAPSAAVTTGTPTSTEFATAMGVVNSLRTILINKGLCV